ncbi:MAG TPA: hypothetical protein VLU25_14420 [Acidobacteriota bacterium]|nr:hypothetical protein [Acidobacteriota bacterium]
MKRCAFLTLSDAADFVIDDQLAYRPLRELGWQVEAVPWRDSRAWDSFHAVVIRSPWDYQNDPEAFLAVLERIENSRAQLFNSLDLVRWNLSKTYLRDLEARGVPIIPTCWLNRVEPGRIGDLFETVGNEQIVIKPVIGANADGAYRLDRGALRRMGSEVESYYSQRPLMAQPFVRSVLEEGEYSLFYFNGQYSHAILKTPKDQDFRVQEEHGADIRSVLPEESILNAGRSTIEALPEPPLYARADYVRANHGSGFWLVELELIEPSLYLRMSPSAPARFAHALHTRWGDL